MRTMKSMHPRESRHLLNSANSGTKSPFILIGSKEYFVTLIGTIFLFLRPRNVRFAKSNSKKEYLNHAKKWLSEKYLT